ncbi:MAG TPA: hypothetical protein VGQ25_00655 [Gemmatimonadales bacterium]|nr:hypothetical protein [Gemmatimonadales bacterium]
MALGALTLAPSEAGAVPSFVRQTGMTCAQCHVMFGAPVPNFTFTGKKFRMNGYRVPFVTERIEAGKEGALGGKRLNISLFPYISLRYQSVFAAQAKSATTGVKGPVTSNPTSRLAIFTGGPVGDYFGLWTEMYLTPDGSASGEWTLGLFSFDEYDFRYTRMKNNNVFGLAFNNQGISEVSGFGPWPVSIPQEHNRGGFAGWSHPNRGNMLAYAWLNDKLLVTGGPSVGQNNLDWKRLSYLGQVAYAVFNSDQKELWVNVMYRGGNDDIPIITNTSPTGPNRTWLYSSNVTGIDATRVTAGPYLSNDLAKTSRLTTEVRYGFIDHGPHSMEVAGRLNFNKDNYRDNASATRNDVGAALRYTYNRTYGLDLGLWKPTTYQFTERTGTQHDIQNKVAYQSYFVFQPAMNMILSLAYSNSQAQSLTLAPTTGWNWSLGVDFLF